MLEIESSPKPLAERSLAELQSLLTELETDEVELLKLKEANPEIASLANDIGLDSEKYKIWQSIRRLDGVQFRIGKVKKIMVGKIS